jgi:hypothetical protein
MLAFFWFQSSLFTNYEALDANAVENEGSEQAYSLGPEFKRVSAVVTNVDY